MCDGLQKLGAPASGRFALAVKVGVAIHCRNRRMKRFPTYLWFVMTALLSLASGVFWGYSLSLGSSFKKTCEVTAALPDAVSKMSDHSDTDVAMLVRAVRGSIKGKSPHTDKAVLYELAHYYCQRSELSPEQREALGGASSVLTKIEELRHQLPELDAAILSEQARTMSLFDSAKAVFPGGSPPPLKAAMPCRSPRVLVDGRRSSPLAPSPAR